MTQKSYKHYIGIKATNLEGYPDQAMSLFAKSLLCSVKNLGYYPLIITDSNIKSVQSEKLSNNVEKLAESSLLEHHGMPFVLDDLTLMLLYGQTLINLEQIVRNYE